MKLLKHLYKSNLSLKEEEGIRSRQFLSLIIAIHPTDSAQNHLVYYSSDYAPLHGAIYLATAGRNAPAADLARMVIRILESGAKLNTIVTFENDSI